MILNMRANLATLVDEFRVHSAETAVVAHRGNRAYRTSYGELADLAGRFSAELERRGIGPGERVVLWGGNSAEWIAAFFGCILRAVIVVPLDAGGTADFAGRVICDTAPRLIVGDAMLMDVLRSTLTVDRSNADATENGQRRTDNVERLAFSAFAEELPGEPLFAVSETIGAQTAFQIVFTSGTTAEPRGIVHTHRNILVSIDPIEREMQKYLRYERIFHPLRFLHMLPLSHVFGQFMGLWCPALLGAEVHFAEEIEPSRIVSLIKRERISVLIAVPRMLALLRAHLLTRFAALRSTLSVDRSPFTASDQPPSTENGQRRTDNGQRGGMAGVLSKWWRFRRVHGALGWKFWAVISGGATLPAELEAFWNRLGFALIQGYGMTETAALVTLNHPFHIKEGTIGRPLPGREVQISADGEVLVRGDMLSEATWQGGAMRRREGEWLATGDLASTSESGELKFLGRKGDVIVTSAGLNIHPGDLEAALTAQAGVRAAAVVACDLNAGPEPVAVVLTTLGDAELQAVVDAANRTLAEFQQIRRVLRWPELQFPYTTTGKLIRRQVAAWACAELSGNRSEAVLAQDSLLAVIAEVSGEAVPALSVDRSSFSVATDLTGRTDTGQRSTDRITHDTDSLRLSEDLHLDSLGRVQLQSALEQRFAIELDDDAIATVRTVGELRGMIGVAGWPLQVAGSPAADGIAHAGGKSAPSSSNGEGISATSQPATDNLQLATPDNLQPATRLLPATEEHLYPRWPWSWPIQLVRTVWIECVMRPLVWVLAAPHVTYAGPGFGARGEKQIPFGNDKTEPLLIVSNHITAYDGAFVLYALPARLRHRVAAAMSGDMLLDYRLRRNQGNGMLNALAPGAYYLLTALFNVFPLPRARGFRQSFSHAGEAMDRGYSVLIFPEGTRSRIGRMNPFRPGIGLLAQQSQVPILPIALVGLYECEAASRSWFHAGAIEIRVGEIIPAPAVDADPAVLTAQLGQALQDLLSLQQTPR